MLSFAQIPQSSANPLLGELYRPSLEADETHRQAMDDWRRTSLDTVDRAILDPDGFYQDKPLPFHPDQQLARKAVTVRSYLTVANDGKPVTGDLYPAHLRDKLARERFDGRGAGSDEAFFTEIQKEAQGRKDSRTLASEMMATATSGALLRETSEAGIDSKSFALWREEAKGKPGYQPGMDYAYMEAWHETQSAIRENVEPYLGPLKQVWSSMQSGGADWYDAYQQVPEENRGQFMASLALLVRAQPAEQQPGLWEKIVKTNSRVWETAAVDTMDFTGDALDDYAANNIGTPGETAEQTIARQNARADARKRRNFIDDINEIRDTAYDPIQALGFGEKVALGIVSTVPFMASAAVPTVGTGLVYAQTERMLARDFRRDLMKGKDGLAMSDDAATAMADNLAPYVAAPYAAIERLQVMGLAGKLPGLERFMAATVNRFQNKALRFAGRTLAAATAETIQENIQQSLPAFSQELAAALSNDVPGVVWKNGKDGFLDGYWENTAVTFAVMLPLSVVAGAGGISRDAQLDLFSDTPDLHLRVLGYPQASIDRMRAAKAQGRYQAQQAIEQESVNRNPMGEEAKDATQELAESLQTEKEAIAAASDAGILPRAIRATDGTWTLYDTATGQEIGQAPDWQRAARLATAHANFSADQDADRVAAVVTAYQAAEASGKWGEQHDRPNEMNLDLGRAMTAEQAASQSAAARQRVEAQERLAGGDGSVTGAVFGESSTELADGLYKTTNRILEGGSVLDVFHEETHGYRRIAHARGILTLADDIAVLRAVDTVLSGTTREGERLAILPENFDSLSAADQEIAVDEGISMLMESEVLRTRKGGGQRAIPAGIVSKNLAALGRLLGSPRLGKFRAFINAIREHFGLAIDRAALIKRGLADGTIDQKSYDSYLQKLLGIDEQLAYEQMARDAEAALIDGAELVSDPNKLDGDPFSIGRSRITPNAETRSFPGAEGSPSVIGPASFSIRAFHGTPHKVDKFTTAKMGTGEGQQVFGWGLYFTETEAIAEGYRNGLSGWKLDGYTRQPGEDVRAAEMAERFLTAAEGDDYLASERLKWIIGRDRLGEDSVERQAQKLIRKHAGKKGGNVYTVTLKPDDAQFLDWDVPLSAQSEVFRNAFPDRATSPLTAAEWYRQIVSDISPHSERAEELGVDLVDSSAAGAASSWLLSKGIRGIRYLDGNSRGASNHKVRGAGNFFAVLDDTGKTVAEFDNYDAAKADADQRNTGGSHNYVIFDEADIEILEENGQPVSPTDRSTEAPALSLGSSRLGILTGDSIRRIKDPLRRAQAMERVSRKLEELRLEAERLELLSGTKRLKRSLAREASIRQALRQAELENEAWARHAAILSDDDLTKLRAQPGHALFSVPASHLHGRLMSKSAAMKKHPDLFQLHAPGEYDGSENVSRSLFGGTLTPDLAAQEAFEAGLIRSPYTDDLWQLLESEARHVAAMKQVLESAKADLREARTVAKAETNAWLATQTAGQEATYSPRQEILRTLAALDAILSSVPPEIRGKVGGYVQAARIADPDAGLEFLRQRLAKVDLELEKWLKSQYNLEFLALLDRARPEKDEAGKKPRGKITPALHTLFREVEDSMALTGQEAEARALQLEEWAANGIQQADGTFLPVTPEEENHLTLTGNMVRLAGHWAKADAARREAAVIQGTKLFEGGYMARKIELSRQREKRSQTAANLQTATAATGNDQVRRDRSQQEETRVGSVSAVKANLLSFEGILQEAFGLETPEVEYFTNWERRAANAKHDALKHKFDALDDLLASMAGGKFKGEQLRAKLQDPFVVTWTDWKGNTQSVSELQGVAMTMMWRQEDGRRHMEGYVDDQGAPSGDWHYREQDLIAIEDQLSDNAKAIRLHLTETYAAEWDRINAVFEQNEGVSLPRHKLYAPLTVDPVNAPTNQQLDPTTGMVAAPSFTPGSLRNRSQTAIAKPNFDADAIQVYLGHVRQMEHYIAYSTFAREMVAVTNRREVRQAIQETAGPEVQKVIGKWLDYFATGSVMDSSTLFRLNRIMAGMMNRFAAATLVGRIGVLAIQSTQLLAAWSYMPTGAYLSRLARLMAGRLDWSSAFNSEYIQRRKNQMPASIQQAMEGLRAAAPSRVVYAQRKLGETIAGADALFTAGTFAITYDYHLARAKKQGMTGQQATDYALSQAEASTERVAQPTRPGTRSILEVTSTNPAFKMLWNFASDARQKLAIGVFQHADRTPMEKARALAVVWLAGGIVSTIIRSAMRDIRDDGEDDEIFDERNWDPLRLGLQAATGPLGGLPYLGDALEAAIFKAAGEYMPEGSTPLSNISKAVPSAKRLFTGESEDIAQALKDAEAILSAGALADERLSAFASFSHIARDLFGIAENATGTD